MVNKYREKNTYQFASPSMMLYRVIGNDLPPRHSPNQTLTNILFILRYEPSFQNVRKCWILNRIVNRELEQTLIQLIDRYKQQYIRIPFRWHEYRRAPYYFPASFPADSFFDSHRFLKLSPMNKIRPIDTIYHEKNLYAMNSNAARNVALKHGKRQTQAQWFMIFDGNCFLSQDGFGQIRAALIANGSRLQYFLVSLRRLTNNGDVFRTMSFNASEEPQTVFRRDSTIEFLETIRYGRGPKEELLTVVGAMPRFWRPFAWEPKGREPLTTFGNGSNSLFQHAGFVFRLYSGYHPDFELWDAPRGCSRLYGIFLFLENLDRRIGRPPLLPPMSTINSNNCTPWSVEEIRTIIRTARQRATPNSTAEIQVTTEFHSRNCTTC